MYRCARWLEAGSDDDGDAGRGAGRSDWVGMSGLMHALEHLPGTRGAANRGCAVLGRRRINASGARVEQGQAVLQRPRHPVAQHGADVEPCGVGVVWRRATGRQQAQSERGRRHRGHHERGHGGDPPPAEPAEYPPARRRDSILAPAGRHLDTVVCRRLHRVMDGGRALAPEIRGARWRLGSRGPGAEGDEILARAEPVAWQAHDLFGGLRPFNSVGLATVLHPVADPLQVFLCRGPNAVLNRRYYNPELVPVGLN